MKRIGRFDAAAAAVLVAASLVGCSDDDPDPRVSPSPTASSPADPSPTSASATPEAETPEAFIERWAELETEMQNTGETAAYRAVTSRCQACVDLADLVEKYYEAGGYIRTEGHTVLSIDARAPASAHVFLVRMRSAPSQYKESRDAPIQRLEGGTSDYELTLSRESSGWSLLFISEMAE